MALLLVMGWALGIFTVGVVLRFGHSAEVIAWAVYTIGRSRVGSKLEAPSQ
jgi:hypothetical protein